MKDRFIKVINSLMWSWGGDPPSEAHWTLEELTKLYEQWSGNKVPDNCKIDTEDDDVYARNLINFIKTN